MKATRKHKDNSSRQARQSSYHYRISKAVKAVAIARGYLAPAGIDLICIPAFANVEIDGEERTAMKLIVEPR